jgi:Cys-tRNA(Pro) deacylase
MQKPDYPVTPAVRLLKDRRIAFKPHLYPFVEHGGTKHASSVLGVSEHAVIKTLVMETESHQGLLVLMHGDLDVSTKQLARIVGTKRASPCDMATAQKFTGYLVGGISPLGARKKMPVYVERTIFSEERIYINGGKRGFLVEMDPQDLRKILDIIEVEVGVQS